MVARIMVLLSLAIVVTVASLGCDDHRARLEVTLAGEVTVAPFVVHGNCLAGWMLSATLRVQGVGEDNAVLTSLDYGVEDAAGQFIGGESLDDSTLIDRYGEEQIRIDEGRAQQLAVSIRVDGPLGAVVLSGTVQARDSKGPLQAAFRLTAQPVNAPPPDIGDGACTAG